MKIYENHAQDARYDEKDTCPTITSRYGTGGGNVPLVLYNHHMQDGRLTESNGVAQTISARDGESGSLPLVLDKSGGGLHMYSSSAQDATEVGKATLAQMI